VGPNSTQVPMV